MHQTTMKIVAVGARMQNKMVVEWDNSESKE